MNKLQKLIGFFPFLGAFLMSDKTLSSYGAMLVGGLVFWIPYWLAWWLSDGFECFFGPESFETDGTGFDRHCAQSFGSGGQGNDVGYRVGPHGFGIYGGGTRIDD